MKAWQQLDNDRLSVLFLNNCVSGQYFLLWLRLTQRGFYEYKDVHHSPRILQPLSVWQVYSAWTQHNIKDAQGMVANLTRKYDIYIPVTHSPLYNVKMMSSFSKCAFYFDHLKVSVVCMWKPEAECTHKHVTSGSNRLQNSWQSKHRSLLCLANFIRFKVWLIGTAQLAPAGRCCNYTILGIAGYSKHVLVKNGVGFTFKQFSQNSQFIS